MINKLVQNRVLQHILFWCLSYAYLLYYFAPATPQQIDVIYTTVFHLPLVVAVYINTGLLVPRLLRRRFYMGYFIALSILVVLSTALNVFLFEVAIDYIFPGYFFISYYDFYSLLPYAVIYTGLTTLLKLSRGWFKLMEAEHEKTATELKFLKMQINPHFLFNSLNSIYSLSLKKDEQVSPAILKLAEVMRYMIYESDDDFVPLENEINYLENYIALQQMRNRTARINFAITGDPGPYRVAPFMFIVFVENGFKHGVETGGFIDMQIEIVVDKLTFTVINNKGILDDVLKEDFKGLGLDNVKRRLALLYPQRHQLTIHNESTLYIVQLQLSL